MADPARTVRQERTALYRAIEAQVGPGGIPLAELLHRVGAELGERPDTVVSSMWDLVDLGSIDYGVDGRISKVDLDAVPQLAS